MLEVIFTPQADIDFAESLNWYSERSVATSERFQAIIEATLRSMAHV